MPFHELPQCAQAEILENPSAQHALLGDRRFSRDDTKANEATIRAMPFWYGLIPMSILRELTLADTNHPAFKTFDDYHEYSIRRFEGRWRRFPVGYCTPVVLSTKDSYTLQDGTLRFHWYAHDRRTDVPAVAAVEQDNPQRPCSE
jgi:hypothetical protein